MTCTPHTSHTNFLRPLMVALRCLHLASHFGTQDDLGWAKLGQDDFYISIDLHCTSLSSFFSLV